MKTSNDIISIWLFALFALIFSSCATTSNQPLLENYRDNEAILIKAVPDWRLSGSSGWVLYFDSFAPIYLTRYQLIMSVDAAVEKPKGRFKADRVSILPDSFVTIYFKSNEQIEKFIDMSGRYGYWRYY